MNLFKTIYFTYAFARPSLPCSADRENYINLHAEASSWHLIQRLTVVAVFRIHSFLAFFLHRLRISVVGKCLALADHAFTQRKKSLKVVRSIRILVRLQSKQCDIIQYDLITFKAFTVRHT